MIFSCVGEDRRFATQDALRKAARISADVLHRIRHNPSSVSPATYERIAAAVGVDPEKLLQAAGHKLGNRPTTSQERNESDERALNSEAGLYCLSAGRFFEMLGERAQEYPFLLIAAFTSPPRATVDKEALAALIELIRDSNVTIVFAVPCPVHVDEDSDRLFTIAAPGDLAAHYWRVLSATRELATYLSQCSLSSHGDNNTARIHLAVPNLDKIPVEAFKIVPPPIWFEERFSLAMFDMSFYHTRPDRYVLASWPDTPTSSVKSWVRVVYDPSPYDDLASNTLKISQATDYFRDILQGWNDTKGEFTGSAESMWKTVPVKK